MAVKINRQIWSNIVSEVKKQIVRETYDVDAEAKRLILETEKTGRMYGDHQASAPGEPFASDTGNAINQITIRFEDNGLTGIIRAGAEYASYLEFGTENMAARPVFRPALANREPNIRQNIAEAVRRGINNSG